MTVGIRAGVFYPLQLLSYKKGMSCPWDSRAFLKKVHLSVGLAEYASTQETALHTGPTPSPSATRQIIPTAQHESPHSKSYHRAKFPNMLFFHRGWGHRRQGKREGRNGEWNKASRPQTEGVFLSSTSYWHGRPFDVLGSLPLATGFHFPCSFVLFIPF